MYIVIVCIVFLALRDFGGRRFISTVLLLLLLFLCQFPFQVSSIDMVLALCAKGCKVESRQYQCSREI